MRTIKRGELLTSKAICAAREMSPKESSSSAALDVDIACSDWIAVKSDDVRRVQREGGERQERGGVRIGGGKAEEREGGGDVYLPPAG